MAIGYLMIGSNDLTRSRAFYKVVFRAIGGAIEIDCPGFAFFYKLRDGG